MRIARSLDQAEGFGPSVLTIGKFDGVHAAHSHLLGQVVDNARERGLKPAAMTFYPHPACVVAPDRVPTPLMSLEVRCDRIRDLGIQELYILQFTQDVARLSPEEFVACFVNGVMHARMVVVGDNFRFGHRQSGDPRMLAELGERYGFETRLIAPVTRRGMVVSTSAIRSLLEQGEVSRAARLLDRPYALSGQVVRGFGVGSKETVPTLNLRPGAEMLPQTGVYITRTTDLESNWCWNSITNVGFRPTFGAAGMSIETHVLDPLGSSAPVRIRVEFLRRVREERKFENPEALKRQILADAAQAQAFFRRLSRGGW